MNLGVNAINFLHIILICISIIGLFSLILIVFNLITIQVEDETAIIITNFGKLQKTLSEPGLHLFPKKILPWIRCIEVSLHRDFREYQNVHVNDCRGTTVIINFWVEFRIINPEKALFHVEDWENSLRSLIIHSGTSILCTQEFKKILCNRHELGVMLKNDIQTEISRWGIAVEFVMIRKVSLIPDVSRQMFMAVAAKLDRVKSTFEEEGRVNVAQLEADVSAKVATLVAAAKGQYPAAVGRAYAQLSTNPPVLKAYQELYEFSVLQPNKTVSFQGFEKNTIRELDAAMVAMPQNESVANYSS